MAPNPPDGAYIDYALQATVPEGVVLEILDSAGVSVRRYTSADQPEKADLAKLEIAPEWIKLQSILSAQPGMHRFVWPLRYAAAPAAGKHDAFADGVWAPPGKYTVVLGVGGQRLTQVLTVAADPRVTLPQQAYVEQFTLARKLEATRARVAIAATQAGKLIEQLAALHGTSGALSRDAQALAQHAHAIAGTRASVNPHNAWAFPPKSTRTLRFVGDALDKLMQAVDGADSAPSVDAKQGIAKLDPLIDASLQDWAELKSTELAALNAKLNAAGQKPVVVDDNAA